MGNSSQDIQKGVYETIDAMIQHGLSNAKFDKTYLCKIIQVEENLETNNYKYTIQYEEGYRTFVIYDSVKYSNNSQVWVKVPQGDWGSSGITIEKKYEKNDSKSVVYRNYDNGVVKVDTWYDSHSHSIEPNGDFTFVTNVERFTFDNIKIFDEPYTTLGIKAKFNTTGLSSCTSGKYGIALTIGDFDDSGATFEENLSQAFCILDSSQFIGNPYNLDEVFFPFSQIYKKLLNNINIIDLPGEIISVTIYQDGQFNNLDDDANISISNIETSLGYLSDEISKGPGIKIFIKDNGHNNFYSADHLEFNLGYYFFHEEENILKVYKNKLPNGYSSKWYRYKISTHPDIGGGIYYGEIENGTNQTLSLDGDEKTIYISPDDDDPRAQYIVNLPDINETQENFKIVIKNNDGDQWSNSISLLNINKNINIEKSSQDIILSLPDNVEYENIFNIYGNNNRLINNMQRIRILATSAKDDLDLTSNLVTWRIPKLNTQIQRIYSINNNDTIVEDELYYSISGQGLTEISIAFKDIYSPNLSNNYIECYCNNSFGTKQINVSTYGTNGTGYSFIMYFADGDPYFTLSNTTTTQKTVLIQLLLDGKNVTEEIGDNLPRVSLLNKVMLSDGPITCSNISYDGDLKAFYFSISSNYTADGFIHAYLNADNDYPAVILQAVLNNWLDPGLNRKSDLTAYLQVPIKYNYNDFSGATKIVYNMLGTTPTYTRDKYSNSTKLYLKIKEQDEFETYHIRLKEDSNLLIRYNALEVPSSFTSSLFTDTYVFLDKKTESGAITSFCLYPMLVLQNAYESSIINSWDENKVKIGDNYILSQIIGAGTKDINNAFTGMLIGDIGTELQNAKTGLYGFDQGVRKLYIGADGTVDITADKFMIDTPGLKIFSETKNNIDPLLYQGISVYEEYNNIWKPKVRLGKIKSTGEYGLDIYKGALRVYGQEYSLGLEDSNASIRFDGEGKMYTSNFTLNPFDNNGSIDINKTVKLGKNIISPITFLNNSFGLEIEQVKEIEQISYHSNLYITAGEALKGANVSGIGVNRGQLMLYADYDFIGTIETGVALTFPTNQTEQIGIHRDKDNGEFFINLHATNKISIVSNEITINNTTLYKGTSTGENVGDNIVKAFTRRKNGTPYDTYRDDDLGLIGIYPMAHMTNSGGTYSGEFYLQFNIPEITADNETYNRILLILQNPTWEDGAIKFTVS